MSPDLAARKIIVAAYLYYVLDAPCMSDGEYDQLSNLVADGWGQLDPVRQWQLGSADAARAGGSHFKFTVIAVDCARLMYANEVGKCHPYPYPHKWKWDKAMKLRYVTAVH